MTEYWTGSGPFLGPRGDKVRAELAKVTAERDALVAENEKLRPVFEFVQGLNGNVDQIHEFINSRDALRAERDALQAQLDRVRAARAEHPKCDIHYGGDPVKCGWKRVVLDVDAALEVTD